MTNVVAVQFPTYREEIAEVALGVMEAVENKKVKAIVVVTIEQGPDDKTPHIQVRHGWSDTTVSAYDLLALSAGMRHSELMVHKRLDGPDDENS